MVNKKRAKDNFFSALNFPIEQTFFSQPSIFWSWRLDLNQRPADYKSAALPTELRQHLPHSLYQNMERETGLEPATYSLEGCRSGQLSYSRTIILVARAGFEPAKAEPTDLQSVPFDRSGTSPQNITFTSSQDHFHSLRLTRILFFSFNFNLFFIFFTKTSKLHLTICKER